MPLQELIPFQIELLSFIINSWLMIFNFKNVQVKSEESVPIGTENFAETTIDELLQNQSALLAEI